MDFQQVVEKRRSVRKFSSTPVPSHVISKALENAILAPNSSNAQTWDFYWLRSPEIKEQAVKDCLGQTAAKTASHLVVVTATKKKWKRSWKRLLRFAQDKDVHRAQISYYEKVYPYVYFHDPFYIMTVFKKIMSVVTGFFRATPRWPVSAKDVETMCIKSAALAAQNFVLSITDSGFDSCMMEGFDMRRLQKTMGLPRSHHIVVVIAVGKEADPLQLAPRFRLPKEEVIHVL